MNDKKREKLCAACAKDLIDPAIQLIQNAESYVANNSLLQEDMVKAVEILQK